MTVRTRNVAFVNVLPGGQSTVLYDVPAGRTLLLREIQAHNAGATAATLLFTVRRNGVDVRLYGPFSVSAGSFAAPLVRFTVLHPGDALVCLVSVPNSGQVPVHVHASGSLLDGAPS